MVSAVRSLCIGIIAGEMSGDLLGAGLMAALRRQHPAVEFIGIGGPAMCREGLESIVPMERLSVMGLVEVLKRLPELLRIRRNVVQLFQSRKPDIFIGIDSPDFNLPIAARLHEQGIKTVHYVSPTVWAWRQKRIFKIARSVDLMLTLFPFEAAFYEKHQVPVKFVGHPFANQIDLNLDGGLAKRHWGFLPGDKVVAVLPGSRGGELRYMAPLFIDAMRLLVEKDRRVRFIIPYANAARRQQFEQQLAASGLELPITGVDGHAREVMAGADAVLVTSGTATLEAALLKCPMVVAYKWGAISHAIISRMVKTEHIALPNILAGERLVPEFLQDEATAENLCASLLRMLDDAALRRRLRERFDDIHLMLRKNASEEAAQAVLALANTASV